ncbi:MAG TPA: septum formation initiator family protein [Spirochaetia bacterium]|jgi:cell division protein FtsB|nr:septum formation initiator family protein [Spirochaetia bacterium]
MKRRWKFALSLYAGFVTYIMINLIWGPGGYIDYRTLREYHTALSENITELNAIHGELNQELEELKSDADRIALEARALGYFRANEGIIRVPGYTAAEKSYSMGSLITHYETPKKEPEFLRAATLSAFLLSYILLSIGRGTDGYSQKRSFGRRNLGRNFAGRRHRHSSV